MDLFILKTWLENKLVKNDRGASMVEYALLVMFIAVVAITATTFLGEKVSSNFNSSGSRL